MGHSALDIAMKNKHMAVATILLQKHMSSTMTEVEVEATPETYSNDADSVRISSVSGSANSRDGMIGGTAMASAADKEGHVKRLQKRIAALRELSSI